MQTLQLNTRLSNKSWVRPFFICYMHTHRCFSQLGDDDIDDEDPFAEVWSNPNHLVLFLNLFRHFSFFL